MRNQYKYLINFKYYDETIDESDDSVTYIETDKLINNSKFISHIEKIIEKRCEFDKVTITNYKLLRKTINKRKFI